MKTTLQTKSTNTTSSVSETGHYKNVVSLNALKVFADGLGRDYAPQKESLKIPNLITLIDEATTLHNTVKDQINTVTLAIDQRQLVFENIKPLCTKIINTMSSTNVLPKTIEDAKFFNAKIQGARIKSKTATEEGKDETNTNSVSRQSYDSTYENFRSLNNLLQQDTNYNPVEADVNITGLTSKENDMLAANKNIALLTNDLSNKRIQRNNLFYIGEESLIAVARGVKKYIRGKFGVNSPQFAQIRNIIFSDMTKK